MSDAPSRLQLRLSSVLPVWCAAIVGVVLVLVFARTEAFTWMLLVLVACAVISFALQLVTQTKDGLVERISVATSGAFVVVLVGTLLLFVLH